ncbi:MAG: glycoside hydrolase family 78 protein, partial [Planctomycetota bacterium]
MRRTLLAGILVWIIVVLGGCDVITQSSFTSGDVSVKDLRCEYRVNPLGIDIVKPRLSWIMNSNQRDQVQSDYQILVADSEEKLRHNQGELWDSGKVESGQSHQVVYEGEPLKSRMSCYWKVRVWDKEGKASAWSKPAMWTVGLLTPGDWQAKWIGYDKELQDSANKGKTDPNALVLPPPPYLRRAFWIGQPIKRAVVYASALGLYELHINGKRIGEDYFTPGWTDYPTRIYYQTYEVTD